MNDIDERHTRDLMQQLAEAKATVDALLSGQREDEACCVAAGTDAYLSKPIEPDALFDVVDGQLSRSGTGGELSLTKRRGSDAVPSVAAAVTENDRHP
jgi:DNA-binding response OmpR family regulator